MLHLIAEIQKNFNETSECLCEIVRKKGRNCFFGVQHPFKLNSQVARDFLKPLAGMEEPIKKCCFPAVVIFGLEAV